MDVEGLGAVAMELRVEIISFAFIYSNVAPLVMLRWTVAALK
jgi:hypothetical protein